MSAYLTDTQLKVLINTIGAVETGGQIYGKQRYDAFASPYKNTQSEHSSTAGAFQEFGENLRQLLLQIQKEYPSVFKKYDTANISKDISGKAWSASNPYEVYAGTAKAKAIIAIISSKEGIIIQDKRIAVLIEKYLKYIVEELKVTNTQAAMFLAQCEHLGGKTPLKRIVDRAKDKNNINALYDSLLQDQNDKSNNNQIGDKIFQTRHEKAFKWIKEKISATDVVNIVKQPTSTTPTTTPTYSDSNSGGNSTSTNKDTSLKFGDTGSAVKEMQQLLIKSGYSCGVLGADGEFGKDTESALKKFQKQYSLPANGIYDKKTKNKLISVNKSLPSNPFPFIGIVTATSLNVRKHPTKLAKNIASHPYLKKDDKIVVEKYSSNKQWYFVCIDNKYHGYVSAKYIKRG